MGNFDRSKTGTIFKMEVTTWLSLAIAVLTFATPAATHEPRVVCYYTNWSVYRPGTARFNPQNINPYLCTHLIYAFGGFTKDNTLKPFDKYQDIEKGGYAKFTGLKTYNKNLKTMLAIGGWNEGSTRFSPMVASKAARKEFVRNTIKFLRQNHFDGLDLDWEYPAFRDGGKPKDRENYAKLVKELREEFERESEKTGKTRLLLTMAVPAGIEYIQKGFDVKTLNRYLDWMNLLTYDYHSAFEPAVNHHAPLFPLEEPNEYSVDNELNIDYTIKFYLESGADRDKLVLGIPTYGRSYTLFNPDATEIGAPADGPGEQGDATREKGYLAYYEICEALNPKKTKRAISSDEEDSDDESSAEEDEPWTVMYPNKDAMGPVAYKGNQWVGYDDIEIVQKKAEYVAENGLGGIMFWSIDNDDFRGTCHEKPYPLIEAAKEAYISKLGSTDNSVVSERPKLSSSSNRKRPRPKASTTTTTAKPTAAKTKINNRKSVATSAKSTTPTWNIVTPEPPTTPDPGSDFKCTDEGFFQHPRDCKKYFWCLDSGPSNLGIVAHQFTCPSGLFFNKAADSCDFARNVLCKKPTTTTKAPTTKAATTEATTTTRKPIKLSTKSSVLFRTTTTTTTPEPEEEYEDELEEDSADVDAEDPKVIKELIDLIKKVGGVEQLEKQLHLSESSSSSITTTPSSFNKNLYKKVLERTIARTKQGGNSIFEKPPLNRQRGPQNAGLEASADKDKLLRKDRPQYTTINRARAATTPEPDDESESEEEPDARPARARAAEPGAAARPLQYVNIRRARPSVATSDTADDTASRNALFERPASFVTVAETPESLDIQSARRDNIPEYVTIRRQRPTTEEATTVQYPSTLREEDSQETILEKEISSPPSQTQPQYTSIVRARSTTSPPLEEPESPEPTTVLSVQLSSLLNTPEETPEPEAPTTVVTDPPTTTTTTAAPSPPTRRTILRRRGSTTTTTSTAAPSTTQTAKSRQPFLRRTKATAPPDTTDTDSVTESIDNETTTSKFTRRGNSKFKTRKELARKEVAKKNEIENGTRRPSLGAGAVRSERPRSFVRRRLGGANATSTTPPPSQAPSSQLPSSSTSTTTAPTSRRPFRIASRRRPSIVTTKSSLTTTSTTQASTAGLASEESLQDIGDTDSIEDPALAPKYVPKTTVKIQRRPLVNLKDETRDQNPSATNEQEPKRHSKKYSSSIQQNQLDELKKSKSQEDTTTLGSTTVEDNSAETAVAIAAHQLLAAPIPNLPSYDDDSQSTKKSTRTQTTDYSYTPQYTDFTEPKTIYSEEFSTPNYESTSLRNKDYISTTGAYEPTTGYAKTTYNPPNTSPVFLSTVSRSPLSTPSVLNQGVTGGQNLGPSTARYLGGTDKYVGVPVEEFGYSTSGYTGQEPSYFTREYLLESPVTKTYDDEYQYLSPVTTPQTTRQPATRKTILRKISTTLPPTLPPATTPKPRRVPSKKFEKPFEKIQKDLPNRTYRPIDNYDYYDDGSERIAEKYEEGTKVVLHGKGTIECLDIGNFPHPSSCKKFISCARIENGSLLGWEYICPKGLSFDPVGGICNWSAGLGCDEKDI
ncbi:mucin-2 [Cydia pomonella]|uniref:mucin-2 n=1 Tax=Cydia pomonella TaxID=82600 RepID=UPI002ADDBB6C|nr:mucin-2 [Cydia pomonella]